MKNKKTILGQYFTKEHTWLKEQVVRFIKSTECETAYDPFAGSGDIFKSLTNFDFTNYVGLDIDETLNWQLNDSLLDIPSLNNAVIITNPPYLSNYSAARKKILNETAIYFESTQYDDLYLIALDKMLKAQKYVVAIVPETFINSTFTKKNLLKSITILEDNPFTDTDTPVCVLCFDSLDKPYDEVEIYKNENFIFSLKKLEGFRITPNNKINITFNAESGWLGLRAVDSTDPKQMIRFDFKENFNYDWEKGIKVSSRLLTLIEIFIPKEDRLIFINKANQILKELRLKSQDTTMSPFKGNMKSGPRRRRLDYRTARAILELTYEQIYGEKTNE